MPERTLYVTGILELYMLTPLLRKSKWALEDQLDGVKTKIGTGNHITCHLSKINCGTARDLICLGSGSKISAEVFPDLRS